MSPPPPRDVSAAFASSRLASDEGRGGLTDWLSVLASEEGWRRRLPSPLRSCAAFAARRSALRCSFCRARSRRCSATSAARRLAAASRASRSVRWISI